MLDKMLDAFEPAFMKKLFSKLRYGRTVINPRFPV